MAARLTDRQKKKYWRTMCRLTTIAPQRKSTACERLMGKARLHIPDFDNKKVKRRENQGAGAGSKIDM